MPILEWDNSMLTGVGAFDEHHQHLVSLLNKTYDMIVYHAPTKDIGEILGELLNYTNYHFAAEERWFNEVNYPKRVEHALQHQTFTAQITGFRGDLLAGKPVTVEVLICLVDWLTDHILMSDMDYRSFVP